MGTFINCLFLSQGYLSDLGEQTGGIENSKVSLSNSAGYGAVYGAVYGRASVEPMPPPHTAQEQHTANDC